MGYWESNGKSDEWFTPPSVFEALGCGFDLDVAHPADYETFVPCAERLAERGLESRWDGFVWMNPPFGGRNGLAPWLDKFCAYGNGIALVPDRTSAPWFQCAAQKVDAILFTRKIKFLRPDGTEGRSPSNGTALMAMGPQGCEALSRASSQGFGVLVAPLGGWI